MPAIYFQDLIIVLTLIMVLLIRFTDLRNEAKKLTISGYTLIVIGLLVMGLQLKINRTFFSDKQEQNGRIEQEIEKSRPILKVLKSSIKWSSDSLNVSIINDGCRSGSSEVLGCRSYKISNGEISGDTYYDLKDDNYYKNLINKNRAGEQCSIGLVGGWISKKDTFIVDFDFQYKDDISQKKYNDYITIYWDKTKIHYSLPSDIAEMKERHFKSIKYKDSGN